MGFRLTLWVIASQSLVEIILTAIIYLQVDFDSVSQSAIMDDVNILRRPTRKVKAFFTIGIATT
jgi:hypothetical protein